MEDIEEVLEEEGLSKEKLEEAKPQTDTTVTQQPDEVKAE